MRLLGRKVILIIVIGIGAEILGPERNMLGLLEIFVLIGLFKGGLKMYKFRTYYIPERMMDGLERWRDYGIYPGDFLIAVLENNLTETILRADDENLANIPAYVSYTYNELPMASHGSKEKMKAWHKSFRQEEE